MPNKFGIDGLGELLPVSSSVLDEGKMDDILDGLEKAYSYVQDNNDVLTTLDGAKKIMDAVGEVCSVTQSRRVLMSNHNSLIDSSLREGGGHYSYDPL